MNHIHDLGVNYIYSCNLLYFILNYPKGNTNINRHYYPILWGCMNTHWGKAKFEDFESNCMVDVIPQF